MKQKNRNRIIIILCILVLFGVGNISFRGYIGFRDTIIEQQQQHLLTISKSISRSLELYTHEKMNSLDVLCSSPSFQENLDINDEDERSIKLTTELETFFNAQENEVDHVLLFDEQGHMITHYPQQTASIVNLINLDDYQTDLDYTMSHRDKYFGKAYKDRDNNYAMNISRPIIVGDNLKGILVSVIEFENMYKRLVQPAKAGRQGYAMVKDSEGNILMHPVKEQIGNDVIDWRREQYPELDYQELEFLIDQQLQGKEGTAIYHSYWWPEERLVRVKKMNAFTPTYVSDEEFWVVAVVMSYDEIQEPITRYLIITILIVITFVIGFAWIAYTIIKMKKDREAYQLEMDHLKELNLVAEELRVKDLELQHARRLKTIGTLTGGISHEFNNLLTPIMGHSEIILQHMHSDNEFYEGVQDIYEASKRAKELIEQILIFSHGEKNKRVYKCLKIGKVIKESIKFLKPILPSNINVIVNNKDCDAWVLGNETDFQQIFMNIYTNAYYAMKEKGGTLTIGVEVIKVEEDMELQENNAKTQSYIRLYITDTGCGMNQETVNQIFDPFFTSKPLGEGTGLGLSVVHGIVKKYGGKITVKSIVDQGSTFYIYLPVYTKTHESYEVTEQKKTKGYEKILLVDDNQQITKVLKKGLSYLGYRVSAFTDSIEALKEFYTNENYYQVIVVDQSMPNIEGLTFAAKVKAIKNDVKIILITAYTDQDIEKFLKERIIDDYIIKPFAPHELSECIRRFFDK
ncbi:sensor histidine kinase [Cellulosilyticum sp. I15G10I2]|uniref:sensor histidine kinase n=1 Tax=Cellulosilyticum sp. I15G10I2 TaxID=1892843 RepID=UPI00085C146D|nr:sensor histidine kinase [Cellulosilyticum sp. I15G10I2]